MARTYLAAMLLAAALSNSACFPIPTPASGGDSRSTGGTDTPPPPPLSEQLIAEKTLSVREADQLVDTGLDFRTTDRVVINADGKIWAGVIGTGENGPQGWNQPESNLQFPLPGAPPFSLIGKASTHYFYIGTGAQVNRVPANGRLYLRTNDDSPGGGSGAFTVRILQYRMQ